MKRARVSALAMAILLAPTATIGQQIDRAYVERRLGALQQQLGNLSARIEQLKAQEQEMQRQSESLRVKLETRLERLEKNSARSGRR